MGHNKQIMGLCGETKIVNNADTQIHLACDVSDVLYQSTKKRYYLLSSYPRKSRHCGALIWDCRYPSPPPWHRPPRLQVCFPLLPFPSLPLPENILHCSNDPGSDIVIVDFGMQPPSIFYPWFPFAYPFTE